jgi:hypothetical protein
MFDNQQPQQEQKPTLQQLIGRKVTIQGREYTFDTNRLNYGKFCDLQAELKSGMKATFNQDTRESEMTFTKEYASKEQLVKTELLRIFFALDVNPNNLNIDEVEPMLEILELSGFMERLDPKAKKSQAS